MPQQFVNHGEFTQVGVKLVADEQLGLIPGLAYIEDAFGVDGQVTIIGNDGSQRVLLMPEIPTALPHTEFIGYVDLIDLTPGVIYRPSGRITDPFGNTAELIDFPDLQFFVVVAIQPPTPEGVVRRTKFYLYAPARAMNQRGLTRIYEC